MPEDLLDNSVERFVAAGEADNVVQANEAAWSALEARLGRDPVSAWNLTKLTHTFDPDGGLAWLAEFVRDPDVDTPMLTDLEVRAKVDEFNIRATRGGE